MSKATTSRLRWNVFIPPFLLLVIGVLFSLFLPDQFFENTKATNNWILNHFDWLFNWATFLFLALIIIVYFSPLGKVKIGGADAVPFLSKWRWFSITLCTTIATGILFWGTAEPLFHIQSPPDSVIDAQTFAMSTMFMHWTVTPYGIYTIAGLMFALTYYNLKQPFSLSAPLYPLLGKYSQGKLSVIIDAICLFALISGMAASLGAGIMAISGGLKLFFDFEATSFLYAVIGIAIVLSFVLSAISGLMKGIRILSGWNIRAFIALSLFVFIFGPSSEMMGIGWDGLKDYVINFLPRSTGINTDLEKEWQQSWTSFYWANWLAWTPITALFLGRLSLGYTVRNFIQFNLIFPSIFSGFWMIVFSGSTLYLNSTGDNQLLSSLQNNGAESVIYKLFEYLPYAPILSIAFLLITFLSYVTAADSNISAMSGICTRDINPENPEAPISMKIVWGLIVGLVAWIMISFAGIDGIKMISTIGGFPALFLIIAFAIGMIKLLIKGIDEKSPE